MHCCSYLCKYAYTIAIFVIILTFARFWNSKSDHKFNQQLCKIHHHMNDTNYLTIVELFIKIYVITVNFIDISFTMNCNPHVWLQIHKCLLFEYYVEYYCTFILSIDPIVNRNDDGNDIALIGLIIGIIVLAILAIIVLIMFVILRWKGMYSL